MIRTLVTRGGDDDDAHEEARCVRTCDDGRECAIVAQLLALCEVAAGPGS